MARRVIRLSSSVTRHWSRRWGALLSLALALGGGALYVQIVLAVHDTGRFELDGNTQSVGTGAPDDWDRVCFQVTGNAGCGATQGTTGANPAGTVPANGAVAVAWTGDCPQGSAGFGCNNVNATIFTGGGSKDPQEINQWAWKDGAGGLPDKDNLVHAFAARYSSTPDNVTNHCPSLQPDGTFAATCEVIYFGSDRFDNSGDAQQGFWFLQNAVGLGSNAVGGGQGFTGLHRNGDLLVISDFSNGGGTSTITVLKWDTSCLSTDNSKNPPAQPCADQNLRRLATSTSALCGGASGDPYCGIVNSAAIATSWPTDYTDKSGNTSYLNGEFFEAGVNLTNLGLGGECFSTVVSETRSSTSTTATLKDFVMGNFANCTGALTTAVQGAGNGNVSPGTQVRDLATVTITGAAAPADATGTVKFFLCGNSTQTPDCSTGGTQIGGTVNLADTTSNTTDGISGALSDYVNTSGNPLVTGFYCFRAEVTMTNYPNPTPPGFLTHTNTTTECFHVKDTSTTTTAQDWLPNDSATVKLSNGTTNGAGTVTFSLFENGTCAGTAKATFGPITLVGGTARTGNISVYTSNQTISWRVTFTSSDPNVDGSTSGCEVSSVTITN